MAKVVVMGAGIGGIPQICELRQALGRAHSIMLIACEKYFLHKVRRAKTEPYDEKAVMKMVRALRLKESA